ncbi:MAG: hypothetical protein WCJ64_26585 [Rhodospirillaceae bacterium]
MLEDIAVVTGGQLVSEGMGIKLENVKLAMLGYLIRGFRGTAAAVLLKPFRIISFIDTRLLGRRSWSGRLAEG